MAINSTNINPFLEMGQITTTNWGQVNEEGERFDCYWNIAKEQAGIDATDEEIAQICQELMELNAPLKADGTYDDTIYANQEILLPLEQTIEEAKETIAQETEKLNTAYNNLVSANSELAGLIQEVETAQTALNNASNETDRQSAYEQYQNALQNLSAKQKEIETLEQEVETAKQTCLQLKEGLTQLEEKYEAKVKESEELKKFNEQITQLDESIKTTEENIAKTKETYKADKNKANDIIGYAAVDGYIKIGEDSAQTDENGSLVFNEEKIEGTKASIDDTQAQQYADKLFESMDGWGTDEKAFNEMLNDPNLTDDDWVKIISIYNQKYGNKKSFIQAIDGDFSGKELNSIQDTISKKLLNAAKTGNLEAIKVLSEEFYNATAGMMGTCDEFIASVMKNADDETLAKLMTEYKNNTGSEIYKDIESDFSGNTQKEYLEILDKAYTATYSESYTGWDDGKLGTDDKAKSIGKGIAKKAPEVAISAVVAGVASVAITTIGAAAGIAAAPVLAVGALIAGIGFAGYQIYKGAKEGQEAYQQYENATTDAEAKEAVENMAKAGMDVAEGVIDGVQIVGGVTKVAAREAVEAAAKQADDIVEAGVKQADDIVEAGAKQADDIAEAGTKQADEAIEEIAEKADDVAETAAKQADETVESGAKQVSEIDEKAMLRQKYKDGNMTVEEWQAMGQDEYDKLRGIGKEYNNSFIGDTGKLQKEILAPSNTKVGIEKQNGWAYRAKDHNFIPEKELTERMSLNVKGNDQLIKELDELMTNGTYINSKGEKIDIGETGSFYYKTPDNLEHWTKREDPITMYFKGRVSPKMEQAIKEITEKYQRGALNGCEATATPWMAKEDNISTEMVNKLIAKIRQYNETFATAVYKKASKNGTQEPKLSAGHYRAFEKMLEEFIKAMS